MSCEPGGLINYLPLPATVCTALLCTATGLLHAHECKFPAARGTFPAARELGRGETFTIPFTSLNHPPYGDYQP